MKNITTLFIAALLWNSCLCQNLLGTVVYSILPPADFRQVVKDSGWVLCDGGKDLIHLKLGSSVYSEENLAKAIQQTQLFKALKALYTIPDARSMYVRGMNVGRSDSFASSEKQVVGIEESYRTAQAITKPFRTGLGTINNYRTLYLQGRNQQTDHHGLNATELIPYGLAHGHSYSDRSGTPGNNDYQFKWSHWIESGEGGDGNNQYQIRISAGYYKVDLDSKISKGDKETRPNSILLYVYMKVD